MQNAITLNSMQVYIKGKAELDLVDQSKYSSKEARAA
jgi:hypothetical protein